MFNQFLMEQRIPEDSELGLELKLAWNRAVKETILLIEKGEKIKLVEKRLLAR